jgi:hypothetical protein
LELAFRARKLDHPRSDKVARHTSAATSGPSTNGPSPSWKLATRMLHWTTRIPVITRTTTAWLPLLQLLYEPGETRNCSPSQLKGQLHNRRTVFQSKAPTGEDKSQDGLTRTSLRPTSTAFFQSCRFSTNQDMSQDGLTRMGFTGPTRPLPKLAAPRRTELWREALRRG